MRTGAVIVAAGMSSRMKSFKPLLQLGGSTVIRTAVTTLQSSGIRNVTVVTGNESEQLEKHLSNMGVTCLYNAEYSTTDMYHSACIGLQHIMGKCDRVFFLPADVPLFSSESLFTMLGYMDCSDCEILIPVHKGRSGHPILLKCSVIPELLNYSGEGGLKGAIDGFDGKKEKIWIEDAGMTLDADKPEDYERLKEYLASETLRAPLNCSVNIGIRRKYLFFNDELCKLLHEVEMYSSLHKASQEMGIAYSKAWKMVRIAENQLGFSLLDSHAGGNCGGGSTITENCRRFINDYEQFLLKIKRYANETFQRQFADYQLKTGEENE